MKKLTPNFDHDMAHLICRKCKQRITWYARSWAVAEELAGEIKGIHTCGKRPLTEREAKIAMEQYRADHPGATFEQQCKAYNEIMRNQTEV